MVMRFIAISDKMWYVLCTVCTEVILINSRSMGTGVVLIVRSMGGTVQPSIASIDLARSS